MDQFLDSIADAVSQLVLLSESDNSLMFVNLGPGAEAVVAATNMLVGIGEEIGSKFVTADMKDKMTEAIDGIKLASREIMESVQILTNDQFSSLGRRKLAKAAKIILSSTVMTLQLTDLFECVKLIKQAKKTLHVARAMVNTTLYSEFTAFAQEYAMDSVDLAQLVVARIGFILDPVCKRKLEENNNLIRCQTQTFLQAVNNVFQNPYEPTLVEYRTVVFNQIEKAIDEIINAARLSSKTMLEACSLDMRMLDAEGKLATDIKEFAEDVGLGHIIAPDQLEGLQDLRSLLGGLMEAAKSGDVQGVLTALDQLQTQRAGSAPSVAKAVLAEEIAQAVRALAFDADEMALQSLQELVDFSLMGLDALAPPISSAGATISAAKIFDVDQGDAQQLVASVDLVSVALQRLQLAVANGSTQEAAAAAKETVGQLTQLTAQSESLAEKCGELRPGPEMRKLVAELKTHPTTLISKTKASLTDLRNQLAKEDFDLEVDKLHEVTGQVKVVVEKAMKKGGGKSDEIKRQIADTTKEIDNLIALMMDAAKTGSTAAVADSVRQLEQLNKKKTKLVQQLQECADEDPVMRSRVASDDESLCALLPPLMDTARQLAAQPNNSSLLDKMKSLSSEAKDFSLLIEAHTHPTMSSQTISLLMDGASDIHSDLQALQTAAMMGQPQGVVAAARSLMTHVDQQSKTATSLREQTEDASLALKVAADCDSLSPLVPPMVASAKLVLQNTKDKDALQRLSHTVKQGEAANAKVVEAFFKMPSTIGNDLEKLRNVVVLGKNASNDEIIEALEPLKVSLAQQSKLAKAMAIIMKGDEDEVGRRRLTDASDVMRDCLDSLSDLLQEALDNPFATLDSQKVDMYIQKAMTAHQIVVSSAPQSQAAQYLASALAAKRQNATLSSSSSSQKNSYDDELLQALEAVSVNEPQLPAPTPISITTTQQPKPITFEVLQGAAKSVEAATMKFQAAQMQVAQQEVVSLVKPQEQVVGFAKLQSKFAESDGTLWGAAKVVAQEMHRLSTAEKTLDMINSSKEIANAVAEICALAQAQADLCADPKLRDQLLTVAVSLRNYSVQLKILSAVKAASEVDEVSTAHSQLVSCGKNLADGVIKIIDYSRIAALKKKKL